MRWFSPLAVLLWLTGSMVSLWGAEFRTVGGDVYRGELSAADKDGLILRLESGDFSPRIDWAKLTDETLRDLVDNPKARRFVEPFIEPPSETVAVKEAKEIPVHQPTRIELPTDSKKGLIAALTTPNGLLLLLALFAANLYGAYEVSRFKWRPVVLVCGVSALLPGVGPIIFLLLPKVIPVEPEHATGAGAPEATVAMPASTTAGPSGGGASAALGLSKGQASGGGGSQDALPKVFKRGEFTFNRRFFETQFPSFFRVVVSEADKDLVLDISAGKKSVVATRISRISMTEVHLKTANNSEAGINFAEISEVKLRLKEG